MTELSAAASTPAVVQVIQLTDFRFRFWPIICAALLMEGLLRLGREP